MTTTDKIYTVAGCSIVCALLLYVFAYGMGHHDAQAEAIKAGVAHYEADPTTGVTHFVYGAALHPSPSSN